jgi:hypothetical protein
MSSSFEVLQFCQAMKESSQAKDKTDKKENKHKKAEDDFQRVFKDNFSSSGFFKWIDILN